MEQILRVPFTHIAFAYGVYCTDVALEARLPGYDGLLAIHRNTGCVNNTIIERIPILRDTTLDQFRPLLTPPGPAEY